MIVLNDKQLNEIRRTERLLAYTEILGIILVNKYEKQNSDNEYWRGYNHCIDRLSKIIEEIRIKEKGYI